MRHAKADCPETMPVEGSSYERPYAMALVWPSLDSLAEIAFGTRTCPRTFFADWPLAWAYNGKSG